MFVFLFVALLTVGLVTLKLANVITWSWGLILAPIWVPLVLLVLAILLTYMAVHV